MRKAHGSDNPSGLMAADELEVELASLEAASRNASRASGTIHVADSALAEVSDLLNTIRDNASSQITGARSSAGAFEKYTVESSRNFLDSARSNISQAISTIRDTDVAGERRGAISSLLSAI